MFDSAWRCAPAPERDAINTMLDDWAAARPSDAKRRAAHRVIIEAALERTDADKIARALQRLAPGPLELSRGVLGFELRQMASSTIAPVADWDNDPTGGWGDPVPPPPPRAAGGDGAW